MVHVLTNHDHRNLPAPCLSDTRRIPPFYQTLIALRTPGRNTAPPVSSHITQRSLASMASLIYHAQTKLHRPTCHWCAGRTKGRSHSFVLDFFAPLGACPDAYRDIKTKSGNTLKPNFNTFPKAKPLPIPLTGN